jgi:hypothetical protein
MSRARAFICLLLIFAGIQSVHAVTELTSPARQTTLLELYTSEGCSSCPPADRWLSHFKSDARLWQDVVPVAFHVDYWNDLGWRDRFSDARYSHRQRVYYQDQYLSQVYTPGIMRNGREWRSWFGLRSLPAPASTEVGVLKAVITNDAASVEFAPTHPQAAPLVLNLAFLGFDLSTAVGAGENGGKMLVHDFVVLHFRQYPQRGNAAHPRWMISDLSATRPAQASGIALWITAGNDPTPLQATGGWLRSPHPSEQAVNFTP